MNFSQIHVYDSTISSLYVAFADIFNPFETYRLPAILLNIEEVFVFVLHVVIIDWVGRNSKKKTTVSAAESQKSNYIFLTPLLNQLILKRQVPYFLRLGIENMVHWDLRKGKIKIFHRWLFS